MSPPGDRPLWSILIATLAHREEKFLRLLGGLLKQAEASPEPVEVVGLQNNGARPIAEYRDALLQDARGRYLSFVDDDDVVVADYVAAIVAELKKDPDLVAFGAWHPGLPAPVSYFTLNHAGAPYGAVRDPYKRSGALAYLRVFSHILPVRADIARQASFGGYPRTYTGEDAAYVSRMVPLLRDRHSKEIIIDRLLYGYVWSAEDTTQNGPLPAAMVAAYADHPRPQIASPCFRWRGCVL